MAILSLVLTILFAIVCFLLVFMVVIQDSDSDSLGGLFAGGSGSAFGSRSTNVVVRFTYILGAFFFVTAFSLAVVNKSSAGNVEKAVQEKNTTETPAGTEWWNAQPATTPPQGLSPAGTPADGQALTSPASPLPASAPASTP